MTFVSTTGTSPAPAPGPTGPLRMTPGRWVALAIGVPVAIVLIGWTGFSLVTTFARGTFPFSDPIPVHNGQVAVNVTAGNITLRPGSGGSASLTGIVQYGLIRPSVSEYNTSDTANLAVSCDAIASGNCGVNAALDAPAYTGVTLSSNGGDIDVSGFSSNMTLSAQGGNITASNLSGHLKLDTGGGDLTGSGLSSTGPEGLINLTAEGGNITANNLNSGDTILIDTGGGDMSANNVTGNSVSFYAEGGNISGAGVVAPHATIDSGGGDVTLAFAQAPQSLTIRAEGGNVNVILPPGNTKYNIVTDAQGGNSNVAPNLNSLTNSPDKININSGGGDISVSQA
jgi:Putative adhesin